MFSQAENQCYCGGIQAWNEQPKPLSSAFLSTLLISSSLLSHNLSFLLLWMRSIQSVRRATRADRGASVPGWIQETFILLFSLGTMCWSGEAAPSSCAHKHRKPHSDRHDVDIHYCGSLFRGSDAQNDETSKRQLQYKTAPTWKEKMCSVTPSVAQVCQHGSFVHQHLFLMPL